MDGNLGIMAGSLHHLTSELCCVKKLQKGIVTADQFCDKIFISQVTSVSVQKQMLIEI